jgi:anti-sigma B factor antagonist
LWARPYADGMLSPDQRPDESAAPDRALDTPRFRINVLEVGDNATVVSLLGEADASAGNDLWRELEAVIRRGGAANVVVDLSALQTLDSSVLGAIVRAARQMRRSGGRLVIVSEEQRVARALELARLEASVIVEPSLAAAVRRVLNHTLDSLAPTLEEVVRSRVSVDLLPGGVVLVVASGDIDASTAPELERRLMRAFDPRVTEVVVDFSPASLVESTTLGVLVETKRKLSARRIPLKLVCSDPRVAKVFTITGFDRLFEIYRSREEALPRHLIASALR